MNILFSGVVLKPNWKGGEPVIAKELIGFLSQRHTCSVSKFLPSAFDRLRSISRFVTKDHFLLSDILNRSSLSGINVVLSFYDFDSSMVQLCTKKKVPIVATQHIYWGLCPKIDFWNNDFVCSCATVDFSKRDCKSCLSKQGDIGAHLVPNPFSSQAINSLRLRRLDFLSRCDAIVVPSNYMARLYEKELKKRTEIRVIHNGIDIDFYKPTKSLVASKKKRILYAGGRTYGKGYSHFLKLASQITKLRNDVEFIAFGYGKDSSHSCVRDNIGYLSKSDVTQAYSDSYLLVFPALWDEPFGLVPLESMACGCPVVAYASGGVSETVVNGLTGHLVPTGDYSQLLKTTLDLIDNESENKRMRTYSREYVVNNFSLKQMLDNYEKVLFEFAKP